MDSHGNQLDTSLKRALPPAAPEWILLIDPVGMRILGQNMGPFLGFPAHFFPDVAFLVARVHPDDRPLANALFTGEKQSAMFRINTAAGIYAWLFGRSYGFDHAADPDASGQTQIAILLHHTPDYYPINLSQLDFEHSLLQHLYRAEASAHFLERINAGATLDQVMDDACAEIIQALNVPYSVIQLYDPSLDALLTAKYHSSQPRDIAAEYYQPISRQTFETLRQKMGDIIVVPDIRDIAGLFTDDVLQKIDIRTLLVTALEQGEELIGVLVVVTVGAPREFNQHELALFKSYARQISDAVARTRLLNLAQRQARSLELLNHIARTALESSSLKEMLDTLTQSFSERLNAAGCMVMLWDEDQDRLLPFSSFGDLVHEFITILADQSDYGWMYEIFEMGGTSYFDRIDPFISNSPQENFPANYPLPSAVMAMPLITKERRLGVLFACFSPAQPGPDAEELSGWEEVAAQFSLAIEKLLLLDQEQLRRTEAETLQKATAALAGQLDQTQVLENILKFLAEVVPLDTAAITIESEDGLHVVAERGTPIDIHSNLRPVPPDFPLFKQLEQTDGPVIIKEGQHFFLGAAERSDIKFPTSWMGTPLIAFGHRIGYLVIGSWQTNTFTPSHARNLQTFSQQAAIAIENSRLFEQVRQGRERLQQLSHRLVEVQEEERRTLSRELHDEVGQVLTGLAYSLEMSQRLDGEALHKTLVEAQQMVTVLMRQVRELSLNLRPSILDDLGLQAALEWLFARFRQQTGILVNFFPGVLPEDLDSRIAITAFRVVQEALTNAARHAQVNELLVWATYNAHELLLQIEDHGAGFDPKIEGQTYESSGITGMAERVSLVGGRFEIHSTPGHGTQVTAVLPVK